MTYLQKSTWPNLTGKTPKEGSIRDIHQKRKARNKATEESRWKSNNEELANAAVEANTAYDKAVQTRADQKDWSDRKRARVERKKGVELGDKDVYYTKGALESEGFKVSDDGKTVSNPDNLDFKLPTGTQTTNIDRDRFRNVYTASGEYKGTRKRPCSGLKDSPDPKIPNTRGFYKFIEKEYNPLTAWDTGGKYGYKRKHKVAEIKKWKEEGRDVSRKDLLTKHGQRKLRTEFIKDKIPDAKDVINRLHTEYYSNVGKESEASTHSKDVRYNYDTTNKKHIYKGEEEKNK